MPTEAKGVGLHHVVIVGGGFGGLYCAQSLKRAPVRVTLIDRRNFHLFQPLLYQVATGGLSPANIAAPLRSILANQCNASVLMDEVETIDVTAQVVVTRNSRVPYDTLVVAAGATHHYFGNDSWAPCAPGLKTIEDATEMRRRILLAFEEAERASDAGCAAAWQTFIVVGGGPTGVELAGALAELAQYTLRKNFRNSDPSKARILLLELADRVLPTYPPELSNKATRALEQLGVTVRTGSQVTGVNDNFVCVRDGKQEEQIACRTVLWAAGVQASPLAQVLSDATGAAVDRVGRIIIQADLSLPAHPEIMVLGDMAHCMDGDGKLVPGIAPAAIQQGRYAADRIRARLRNHLSPPFRYVDKGCMAVIGRSRAVANLGWVQLDCVLAWLAWLLIHLAYLVEFGNRILVLTQWAWNYVTRNRSARLITLTPQSKERPDNQTPTSNHVGGEAPGHADGAM